MPFLHFQIDDFFVRELGPQNCSGVFPGLAILGENTIPEKRHEAISSKGAQTEIVKLCRQYSPDVLRVCSGDCLVTKQRIRIGIAIHCAVSLMNELKEKISFIRSDVLIDTVYSK